MAFIGNTNTTQAFTPAIDYFSGTGSATAFTLSRPVASVAQVQVTIDNVAQNPSSAYTVSGNTITFTSAPLSGTNNIYVYYTSPITQVIAPGQGTVTTAALDVYGGAGTSAMNLPSGTTAQRPGTPANGGIRYNSTTTATELYQNSAWATITTGVYSVDYLIVAGGGSGGYDTTGNCGGGGAGGYIASSTIVTGGSYSIVIGAGGTAPTSALSVGVSGSNSTGFSQTAIGGGGGGAYNNLAALTGGSGGGGGQTARPGAAGTSGQGYAGGASGNTGYGGGGGGGAGAIGGTSTGTNGEIGGNGGVGLDWQSLGTYYGGGGGGSNHSYAASQGGIGGTGGGGNGHYGAAAATAGTTNRGGGGGGGGEGKAAASGGSGIVIIRYAGAQRGTGGTVTSSGGYTIHTFTSSGTYTA